MANTSLALMTQSSLMQPGTAAGVDTAVDSVARPTRQLQASEGGTLEFSGTDTVFSLILSQAETTPTVFNFGVGLESFQVANSAELEMAITAQSEAYDLVTADGNHLPFFGNFLPVAASEEDLPVLPAIDVGVSQQESQLFKASSESINHSMNSLPVKSSVAEDIDVWLNDPGLSFVSARSEILQDSESKVEKTIGDPSLTIAASGIKPQESSNSMDAGNKLGSGSRSLTAAMSELASRVETRVAESEDSLDSTDLPAQLTDPAKTATNQIKRDGVAPEQLFAQLGLNNQKQGELRNAQFSERRNRSLSELGQLDRSAGRMAENYSVPSAIVAEALGISNRKVTNSVDSFVNVLLNIDTSAQSSSSVTLALEQWKAEQASRTALVEQTDVMAKSGFARVGVPVHQPGWGENLGKQLATLMARNLDSAQIQLDPPELGPLQVKIQVQNDQVSLHFTSAHGAVREALEASSARLQEMFQDEGLELASLDVTDQGAGQQQSKDSQGRDITPRLRDSDNSSRAQLDGGDGLLTLSTEWQQDEGKIDYFI